MSPLEATLSKQALRSLCRQKRQAISSMEREQAASSSAVQLSKAEVFKRSRHIGCYLAYNSEFLTDEIIKLIWQQEKICYLPVICEDNRMLFEPCLRDTPLIENKFGIKEPALTKKALEPSKLDLVITPLLAFDDKGNRLGAGMGYYDRAFATKNKQTVLVGLAYECQKVDVVPTDEWDVCLDGVITEKRLIKFNKTL